MFIVRIVGYLIELVAVKVYSENIKIFERIKSSKVFVFKNVSYLI